MMNGPPRYPTEVVFGFVDCWTVTDPYVGKTVVLPMVLFVTTFVSSAGAPVLFLITVTGRLLLSVTRKSQPSFQIGSFQGGGFEAAPVYIGGFWMSVGTHRFGEPFV